MEFIGPYGVPAGSPYQQGDAAANVKGSYLDFRAIKHPMDEIVHVIEQAGLTPTEADLTQLYQAIGVMIADAVDTHASPAGKTAYFARSTAPTGWLKANGAAVSRTTYASLFAAIGTTFGAGDGTTTFNLPDLRGEFLRGLDDGRSVDTGRALGSAQAQMTAKHQHLGSQPLSFNSFVWGGMATTSTVQSNQNDASASGTYFPFTDDGTGTMTPRNPGTVTGTPNAAGVIGDETRPRNVALLACIKY